MKLYSMEEERKRLDNITYAENAVKKCTRRVRIHDYIPGQISYNLGGYPAKFSITPTEYDYEVIKALKEKGVGLIQVHEEWNDAIRVLGADKYSSHDPEGMRKFIELCHDFGLCGFDLFRHHTRIHDHHIFMRFQHCRTVITQR